MGKQTGTLGGFLQQLQVHSTRTITSVVFDAKALAALEGCTEEGSPGWCKTEQTVYVTWFLRQLLFDGLFLINVCLVLFYEPVEGIVFILW